MFKADIIFTTSERFFSGVVRHRTWGAWSHVMLATGDGYEVISADASGVTLRQMTDDERKIHAVLHWPEISQIQQRRIVDWARETVGAPYDFWGLGDFLFNWEMQDDQKFFCSEHVFLAYKEAGIRLLKRVPPGFVSPRDIWVSPILERQWETATQDR